MRSEVLALGVILTLMPAVSAAQTAPLHDKLRLAVEKLDQGDDLGARFEVSIGAAADGSGFEVTLVGRSHSEPLYRGAIMVDGDSSDADADLQIIDRVTEIEAWLAQPHGGPGA